MSENNETRTFGQGAVGEKSPVQQKKVSPIKRLRFAFDNSLTKNGGLVWWTIGAIILLALVLTAVNLVFAGISVLTSPVAAEDSFFERVWIQLTGMLGFSSSITWGERIFSLINWIIGLAVTASVITARANATARTLEKLKKGKSPVLVENHILILGWSERIYTILKELVIANENVRKQNVVIFAPLSQTIMDDKIDSNVPGLGTLKVIFRTGDPTNTEDLKRTNLDKAKCVIVLDGDSSSDASVVSTVLAVQSLNSTPDLNVIAEVDSKEIAESLKVGTNLKLRVVRPTDVISKVTAQASRQPGIPSVILEMLDFDGDEIYMRNFPALAGKTYLETQQSFRKSAIFGIETLGKIRLNPPANTVLLDSDRVIALSEDDDTLIYTGTPDGFKASRVKKIARSAETKKKLLIIGWSKLGKAVAEELATFMPKGSTVQILGNEKYIDPDLKLDTKFTRIQVQLLKHTGGFKQIENLVLKGNFDEILILGYRHEIAGADADALTLTTMMQLNHLFQKSKLATVPRLVTEILDSKKVDLAQTTTTGDLVVSENLAGLLIAQLSENPELSSIFDNLFNPASGAAVHVKDVADYAKLGSSVTFAELVAAASAYGESAIGYKAESVQINPDKEHVFVVEKGHGLVVIGKSI